MSSSQIKSDKRSIHESMHLNFMVIDGIIYVANRSILIISKVNQIAAHLKIKYRQSEIKVTLDKTDVH